MKKLNPLKIIPFYKNEKQLIKKALAGNKEAQKFFYTTYAPKMLSICRQYIKDLQFAEDVMIEGFVKVFKHLHTFRHQGSFEGWIKRIMIRECISHLRKKQFVVYDDEVYDKHLSQDTGYEAPLEEGYLQKLIDALPEGYKMVFVLYAVEGYRHAEIAEMLDISVSTSKSQLFKARKLLQAKLASLDEENRRRRINRA